jgi:hypothetical protein
MADTLTDHELNTELLNAELPDARFVDSRYLRWLYDENPLGRGIYENGDEGGRRMAHYAVIPQRYRSSGGRAPMVFSLNAVTRRGGQRRGWFTTLGEAIYARAAERGALGVIGVSNVNSTPPVVRKLDFRLLGPLPVRVALPGPGRERPTRHWPVDEALLAGDAFGRLASDLDDHAARGWTNCWTADYLRWRLAAPNLTSRYWLHADPEVVAVSALDTMRGLRVPVVLKLLPRGGRGGPIPAGPMVGAICRYHRGLFAVYAGFNRHVRVRGIRPPRRLQPSPLNLIFRSLSPDVPKEGFVLDTFEFLDMDAY